MNAQFKLPSLDNHVCIVGRNGSGKTQGGAWLLSLARFDVQPYIIVDYKEEELLNAIPHLQRLKMADDLPEKPGVYIVHPDTDNQEQIEDFLLRVHHHRNTGLFIDEAYSIDRFSKGYKRVLTQGRSRHIPTISCTQRPAHCAPFLFSEAHFYMVYHLNSAKDMANIENYIPSDIGENLPEYNCRWYDVKQNALFTLKPVPDADTILETFDRRLTEMRASDKKKRIYI